LDLVECLHVEDVADDGGHLHEDDLEARQLIEQRLVDTHTIDRVIDGEGLLQHDDVLELL
jgi:hypothetical protein